MAVYFLDGTNLTNSTAVFTDEELVNCAPDGYYSDGNISRRLVDCTLWQAEDCPSCGGGPPPSGLFLSGPATYGACENFCDTNYIISLTKLLVGGGGYADVTQGSVIQGEVLQAGGFYAYSDTQYTQTQNGGFRILKISATVTNYVDSISVCGSQGCQVA
tara:strand:- start:16034 stop:16513 length:480 start_codon:yes stop_codon:yes gene_type:complete